MPRIIICKKCGKKKEHKAKGLCAVCYAKPYVKKCWEENKERYTKMVLDWQKEHPEKNKEYSKKWRDKNPNYNKEWRDKNKEQIKEYEYKRNRTEHRREYMKNYHKLLIKGN